MKMLTQKGEKKALGNRLFYKNKGAAYE